MEGCLETITVILSNIGSLYHKKTYNKGDFSHLFGCKEGEVGYTIEKYEREAEACGNTQFGVYRLCIGKTPV